MLKKLEQLEAELNKMPSGDDRAERTQLIDQARREIMIIEAQKDKKKPSYKAEERVQNIFDKLMRPDYEDPSLDCPTDFSS